ncbi:MAG: ABC transporter permease [Solirubrobacteraceae bacterium]
MRWLLIKDLQILKRSPLLVGMLVIYPVVIALMIGLAFSSPPGKPKVAFLSEIKSATGRLQFGARQIDIAGFTKQLLGAIQPITVRSRSEAIEKVRSGQALAALIVPADLPAQINGLVTQGIGNPTVDLILNSKDPIERQFVDAAIQSQLIEVEQAVSKQLLKLALTDLQQVLDGGTLNFVGQNYPLLGLRDSRAIIEGTIATLPRGSALIPALRQVVRFAGLAIEGLGFAGPVLGTIGTPVSVDELTLAGKTTPIASYAVAIAVVVSLMFVTLLLAAAMLALERSQNTFSRLIRGLVAPGVLLGEKILLAACCAAAATLAMAAAVSLFVHLDWSRSPLWVLAIGLAAVAFASLGVAIGAIARDVSAASLMAFLLSLPIAFVALVPASAVSGTLDTALTAISFLFPFRAGLDAVNNALTGGSPSLGLPLVHLLGLTIAFWALGRLALRRFAA